MAELLFIDEHRRTVAAPPLATWEAVRSIVAKSMDDLPRAFARVWGLEPTRADGRRPLESGSALPGFRVAEAAPGRSLRLEGRHRFSTYRLEFVVEDADNGACVRACSYAAFPGVHGAVYRALVVGSGGHNLVMRRMLAVIARHAERT